MGDIGRTIGGTRSVLAVMRSPSQRDEFTEFVRARSSALHRAAYLMVGDVGLAEDLVQEALAKTYVAWPRIRDKRAAEAYARKVVTTTAISWFRRKAWKGERAVEQVPEGGHGDHAVDVAEQTRLWAALLELPVRQRTAIVLRYYEDLTEAQTAAAMGCAVGTVKSQVSAGMVKLRDRLGNDPELLPTLDHMVVTR